MLKYSAAFLGVVLTLTVTGVQNAAAQGNGSNHSQNIEKNNGIAVQANVEIKLREAARRSNLNEGGWIRLLLPGHDEVPPSPCLSIQSQEQVDPTALKIFYGTNVDICTKESCVIVEGERGATKYPLIKVRKVKGGVVLDAKVFDQDGNIIASVEGNKTHINTHVAWDFSRQDEHSLRIKDNHDKEVLYVRLLNKNALLVRGLFYLPDEVRGPRSPHAFLEISKDHTIFQPSGNPFENNCSKDSGEAVVAFPDN